jgi:hypothetical protein
MDSSFSEVLRLQQRLSHLPLQRKGFAVCLVGEAGIGKTHTLEQLRRALPYPSHTLNANHGFEQLVQLLPRPKHMALWLQKNLERQDSSLPTVLGLLEACAPCAILLEDLHDAPHSPWLLLAEAIAKVPKVALVLTSRLNPKLESIQLLRLNQTQSQALLERELGTALPEAASTWIFERASGHPLFTLEYLRFLARLGALWNDGTSWHWREPHNPAMPTQVEVLLEERLLAAELSPSEKPIVLATAYLESRLGQVWDKLLMAVCGIEQAFLQTVQQKLLHLGIAGQKSFSHPLLRQVAFEQGRNQHKQFAQAALDALQDQPELAMRCLEDAGLSPAQQAQLWRSSAEKLADQPQLAAQYRLNAAQHLHGQEKVALLLEALSVLGLGEPQKAISIARSVLELGTLEPEAFATAIYGLCHGLATTTRNLAAVETELARLGTSEQQSSRFVLNLLGYKMVCGQAAAALNLWQEHPEIHDTADFVVQTHLLSAWVMTGQFERVLSSSQAMLDNQISDRQRMNVLNIRAIAFAQTGQLEAAETTQLHAIEVAKKTAQPNAVGTLLFNRAMTLERQKNPKAMRQYAEEAAITLTQAGNLAMASQAQLLLANQDFEQGKYSQAQNRLETAFDSLKFGMVSPYLVALELTLAQFHRERRLPYSRSLAQKFARDALQHAQTLQQPRLIAAAQAQTVLCAAAPDLEVAREALAVLRELPEAGSIYAHAAWARALETVQPDQASPAWEAAANRAEALGFVFDANLLRLEVARLLNNRQEAKLLHDWFFVQGFLHGANIAQMYFPDLGQPSSTPSPEFIVLDTMQIGLEPVKGKKRQELLLLLLEARVLGKSEVSSLSLLERLYPNQIETEAQIALRQLIFKIRNAHGMGIIQTTASGYALGDVTSDLERFLQTPDLALWRVAYPSFGSEEVRDSLHQTVLHHAKTALETGLFTPSQVVSAMGVLLESDPYNLAAIVLGCQALERQADAKWLRRFYSTHKTKLLEVGEVLPEDWKLLC